MEEQNCSVKSIHNFLETETQFTASFLLRFNWCSWAGQNVVEELTGTATFQKTDLTWTLSELSDSILGLRPDITEAVWQQVVAKIQLRVLQKYNKRQKNKKRKSK